MSPPRPTAIVALLLVHTILDLAVYAQVNGPRLHFGEKVWDFGEAVQGQTLSHQFVFENRGNGPLIISLIRSGCSTCSGAVVDSKVTKPNQEGRIKVTFYTGRAVGAQNKRLFVHSNDASAPYVAMTIRGTVKVGDRPAIVVSPETWDAGIVRPDQRRILSLKISNAGAKTLEVRSVETSAACALQRPMGKISLAKGEAAAIELTLDPSKLKGVVQEYAYIQSNDPVTPVKVVQVLGYAASGIGQESPSDAVVIRLDRERIRVPGTGRSLARALSIANGLDSPLTVKPAAGLPSVVRTAQPLEQVLPGRRVTAPLELIDGRLQPDRDGYLYLVIGIPVLTKTD